MATESEVCGSCVGEINVSVEIEISGVWLCCGKVVDGIIWDLFWREKWLNICGGGGRWCQVLEGIFDAFDVIEEIKSPCGGRGLRADSSHQ